MWQREMTKDDRGKIEELLTGVHVFCPEDVLLAMELVDAALNNPEQKDYDFILSEGEHGQLVGYACFGPTPLTDGTYDLYWIAVAPEYAGQGIGTRLLKSVEERVLAQNARMIVIETSSSEHYALTRRFYLKNGYWLAETIRNFYRKGEDRVTYIKTFRE